MSLKKVKEYSVPFKDKVEGQVIDPIEWNANFLHLEEVHSENRSIINELFDKILNDGANNILINEDVLGGKLNLKEALINILNKFNDHYTKLEIRDIIGLVIDSMYIENGELFVLTKDGQVVNLGSVKGEKGDKGDPGEKAVTTQVGGFFTLAVDAGGNLWAYSEDDIIPEFEYDAETGKLYFITEQE